MSKLSVPCGHDIPKVLNHDAGERNLFSHGKKKKKKKKKKKAKHDNLFDC